MGREIRVESGAEALDAGIESSGARHAKIRVGDVVYECELVHRSGAEIVIRVGTTMVTLHELERGSYVIRDRKLEVVDGVADLGKTGAGRGSGVVKAVMPGLVIKVNVQEGQAVEAGTPLLVLEAMKMENEVKSPGAGVVKKINVKPGEIVETGAVLVELEDG